MKLVILLYQAPYYDEIMGKLKGIGIEDCYSKISNVLGHIECSEPRLNTRVWPGTNEIMIFYLKEDKLVDDLKNFKTKFPRGVMEAFIVPLLEII